MKPLVILIVILYVLFMVNANLYFTFAQKFSINSVFDNVSNLTQPEKTLDDDYKFSQGKYESDQINEIIYRLYEDYLHSDKNEFSHYQDIGVLIDFICSNKLYENSIEACDIITELPIE
ncbi:MAG TPA: hypothetical protein VF884_01285 [Nitrososphaeraceae archaeon]